MNCYRKKGPVLTEEEQIMQRKKDKEALVRDERQRVAEHRRKNHAAATIQKAWRRSVPTVG